jgi:hypothetical protein
VERDDRSDPREFLPPEPAGPEPELGRPDRPADEPPTGQDWQQPQHAQGWQPPPQQDWQQQAPPPPPPPGYGYQPPPPGYPPPPPPGWQPPPPAPGYGYAYYPPAPPQPENGSAVAGFVVSIVAGALLLLSGGLAAPVSLIAAPFGIYYSRKGKRAVDEGKTPKHRGLAQAGFIVGIVTVVLSVVAIAFWTFAFIEAAKDDSGGGLDGGGGFDSTRVRAALAAARFAALLLS